MSDVEHEMGWHKVRRCEALPAGTIAPGLIGGSKILLARLDDGTLAAASAVCPHQGADLTQGMLYFDAIDCPLHHYVYDLRTGQNRYPCTVFPADMTKRLHGLHMYPIKEEDGWIWVGERTR